jgi:hypothetical protein
MLLQGSADRSRSFIAKALALPASLRADGAVLVLLRVPLALLGTGAASQAAGLEHRAQRALVASRAAGSHRAGSNAGIGAVLIEPDALRQLLDHVLAEACIRASGAGLRAVEAGFDATDQNIIGVPADVRVGGDHLLDVHAVSSPDPDCGAERAAKAVPVCPP